jgi:septal ring factor EnvC (AmiA/AmiB activator)
MDSQREIYGRLHRRTAKGTPRRFHQRLPPKALGRPCNAERIGKQLDELMAQHEKLEKKDHDLEEQIKTLDNAVDYHTKANREKRKALQERRNVLAKSMEAIHFFGGRSPQRKS